MKYNPYIRQPEQIDTGCWQIAVYYYDESREDAWETYERLLEEHGGDKE